MARVLLQCLKGPTEFLFYFLHANKESFAPGLNSVAHPYKTHQQWREEQCQDKLPSPVQHAGEGHSDGSARLVKQLGCDEPRDWTRSQFIGRDKAENQKNLQAAQLWHQVLHINKLESLNSKKKGKKNDRLRFQMDPTRTESVMVVSRLHTAMQMKPVRSSFLRPARSIRKNLEGNKQPKHQPRLCSHSLRLGCQRICKSSCGEGVPCFL